ncbi:lonely Cys domain-containing protein, partial [Streptomyces sp. NPDC004011]
MSRADLGRQATVVVTSPGHAAAVEVLDAVRRDDRALRAGPLDVDAVARRVFRLDPHVLVDPEMRRDLYTMTERALAAGRASGVAALTAFHLQEEGVLAADRARYVSVGGTRTPGLNWTGSDVAELDSMFVDNVRRDQAGAHVPTGAPDFAPWALEATPYTVLADGSHDTVTALLPDGTTRVLDADAFVELVAADPELSGLPSTTSIVLAVPFAGDRYLDLPRKLADRTGRTVWAHSGLARRHTDPAAAQATIAVIERDKAPRGSWVAVRPGLAPDADEHAPDWHRDVLSQPIVSATTGQQIGRSMHTPEELAWPREHNFSHLDRATTFVHLNPVTDTYSAELPLTDPGPKDKAYHLAGHGLPGQLVLPLADGGSRTAGRQEAGEWLKRRKSLSSLPKDHWIDMVVCYSAAPRDSGVRSVRQAGAVSTPVPFAADPLADESLSMGQHLANVTGRTVRLSHGLQGAGWYQNGPTRVLWTDARGRRWGWETARPEPDEAGLDRLARLARFTGEPTPESRAELLRLVRALRQVFGPEVEDTADYPALLLGGAAVVNMWFADPDLGPAGPFSPELLRRVIAAHPDAASGVDPQVTRRVLAAAAQAWKSGHPPVSRFVNLPVLHSAARWLQDTAAVDEAAAAALGLSGPDAVVQAERTRMFWARVRAEETLTAAGPGADALTMRVLHLDPGAKVDDALRDATATLLARGFAAGRDMADPDVAAAYDLETRGAFAEQPSMTTMDSAQGDGRDWEDGMTLLPDLGRFRTPGGLADAPWAGKDASGKDRPVPYVVRASVDPGDGDLLDVTVSGASFRVPAAEFAELLAADPELRGKELTTPLLLVLDGLGGHGSGPADEIARRLGRSVWWSPFPVDWSGRNDEGTPVPTLTDSPATLTSPTAADWRETRPVDPAGAQEGPR